MKAITLTQPWATLIAIGAKKIETRSWSTSFRGPLAIHAAKGLGPVGGMRGLKALCATKPFSAVLTPALERWWNSCHDLADMAARPFMPLGAIVAVCELINIARVDYYRPHPDDIGAADWEGPFLNFGSRGDSLPGEPELSFGDYSPGRYAWLLADIRALPEPIPAKGALSLWEYEGKL